MKERVQQILKGGKEAFILKKERSYYDFGAFLEGLTSQSVFAFVQPSDEL